jgi:hypothetical protein
LFKKITMPLLLCAAPKEAAAERGIMDVRKHFKPASSLLSQKGTLSKEDVISAANKAVSEAMEQKWAWSSLQLAKQ